MSQRLSSVVIAYRFGDLPQSGVRAAAPGRARAQGDARSTRKALLPRELLVELYMGRGLSAEAIERRCWRGGLPVGREG